MLIRHARQYMEFSPDGLLEHTRRERGNTLKASDAHEAVLRPLFEKAGYPTVSDDYHVARMPLVTFMPGDLPDHRWEPPTQAIIPVTCRGPEAAQRFRDATRKIMSSKAAGLHQLGVDPVIGLSDYSIPIAPDAHLMGTGDHAKKLIKVDALREAGLEGEEVNVVVIDAGFDRSIVPRGKFGGGWYPDSGDPTQAAALPPGKTTGIDGLHGAMIVNNILAAAPKARFFDVPLIRPPKIGNIPSFVHQADETYRRIFEDIPVLAEKIGLKGSWVFVNAWAIYDRRSELPYLGEYSENLGHGDDCSHPFIKRIDAVTKRYDVVFCAGNCGGICPDGRCGPNDYGPHRSIWGAAAHHRVLAVGAVRVDGSWCGYSSQGPGPGRKLSCKKPDICAPTQFISADGRYPASTGSSASAAVAAGVVAALRSGPQWSQGKVKPKAMLEAINSGASLLQPVCWDSRLGHGIMNAQATMEKLRPR